MPKNGNGNGWKALMIKISIILLLIICANSPAHSFLSSIYHLASVTSPVLLAKVARLHYFSDDIHLSYPVPG